MGELNQNLSQENIRTLEPFFDDAAEKIIKMKKGIEILSWEYCNFLIWLGMPPATQSWSPSKAATVLLDLRQEVMEIVGNIEEEAKNKRKTSSNKIKANGNSELNDALKEKLASRRGRVRKSLRNVIGEK